MVGDPFWPNDFVRQSCTTPEQLWDPHEPPPDPLSLPPCWRPECGPCGPCLAAFSAAVLEEASPRYSGVASWDHLVRGPFDRLCPSQIHREVRPRLEAIYEALSARYTSLEMAAVVELSADDRPHAHVLLRGGRIRHERFHDACVAAGLGYGNLQEVRSPLNLACYVLKLPLWASLLERGAAAEALELHTELNGGDLLWSTGGFCRKAYPRPEPGRPDSISDQLREDRELLAAIGRWVDRKAQGDWFLEKLPRWMQLLELVRKQCEQRWPMPEWVREGVPDFFWGLEL